MWDVHKSGDYCSNQTYNELRKQSHYRDINEVADYVMEQYSHYFSIRSSPHIYSCCLKHKSNFPTVISHE